MPEHYHDENDLKLMRDMRKLAPDDFNAWLGLNSIVGRENGAIPKKYRELIAIAVSATTQCPYCMEAHAKAAKRDGQVVGSPGQRPNEQHVGQRARGRKRHAEHRGTQRRG